MTKDLLRVAAIFKSYHPLVDGSMTLSFQTQEVDRDLKESIFDLHRQFGWLLFSPNDIQPNMVPSDEAMPHSDISPSKKLKNTIYALYIELGSPYGKSGFQKFYEERVERLRGIIIDELQTINRAKQNGM